MPVAHPSLDRFRAYLLEAGTELLGEWLVEINYGRIGRPGRRVRHVVANEPEARQLVREILRKRAPQRRDVSA